jgi:Cytochrome P460
MSCPGHDRSPKTGSRTHRWSFLCFALLAVVTLGARGADGGSFPAGYRAWTVAKFRFESKGALRYHYANSLALASWGKFDDGSILVDEKVHATLGEDGTWREADIAHVAVMRKDAKSFPDTGGWYFNFFGAGDSSAGLTPGQAKTRCFDACHKAQEARDYVFSDPRR